MLEGVQDVRRNSRFVYLCFIILFNWLQTELVSVMSWGQGAFLSGAPV